MAYIEIKKSMLNMNIVAATIAPGLELKNGAPVVIDYSNERPVARATDSTPKINTFPVYYGTDFSDVTTSGSVPVIVDNGFVFKTDVYDTSQTYAIGDPIIAKDGKWTLGDLTSNAGAIVGYVIGINDSTKEIYIFYGRK